MKLELEAYSLADPLYFDTPSRWRTEETAFAVEALPTPDGWQRNRRDVWVSLRPTSTFQSPLPAQGWKVHVSAALDNAERVLDKTWAWCVDAGVAFKYLCSRNAHRAMSFKYAPRASSGKLVTIYPADERSLQRVLTELSAALSGEAGPYILSDLRYGDGPLYVRYGGFVNRYCVGADGDLVEAIEKPDGTLVPDLRRPVFEVPPWVEVPDFLRPHLDARAASGAGDWRYRVEEALHFSNGGGVYLARRLADDTPVVLKEARPLAGVDGLGRDAVARLLDEHRAMERLAGIPGVPRLYEHFTIWEHHFLAVERMPGENLQTWLAKVYPDTQHGSTAEQVARFTRRALSIVDRVSAVIAAMHARGVVFVDLHPANILIGPADEVSLVDFEVAMDATDDRRPTIGYPGFIAPAKRGPDIDRHALGALRLWLFLPLTMLLGLVPDKAEEYIAEIERRFDLPDSYGAQIRAALAPPPGAESPAAALMLGARPTVAFDTPEPDWPAMRDAIAGGILASATPERTDRLFPGDPQQFALDGLGVAYGAAGVLWALSTAGAGRHPALERWLVDAARRHNGRRVGFYDGTAGLAYVLDHLGHPADADALLAAAAPRLADLRDVSLFSGLAGVGLNLLHFAARRGSSGGVAGPPDEVMGIAGRLAAAVRSGAPHGVDVRRIASGTAHSDLGSNAGLLRGWSGVALFLIRLHETWLHGTTGDPPGDLLDAARDALHRDLDLCRPASDGTLQVDGGFRTLPYLEIGSAGIALVAAEYLRHRPDARLTAALPALADACRPRFVIEPQLFNGRAGLLATLAALRGVPGVGADPAPVVADHVRRLGWHALAHRGHTVFPGEGLKRLSMDVATGSAGILLALSAACTASPALPLLGVER